MKFEVGFGTGICI